jgi:RNA ligase (TIGR02306 family)
MKNENSVCFVSAINNILDIPDADNIELAVVNGWFCIVKKGSHSIGDLVVCATTDAVIPLEISEKLGVTNYLRSKERVRTIKLRGVYSECLLMPIDLIPESKRKYGEDLMDVLKIYKYEPPARLITLASGKKRRYHENPNFYIYYKFPNFKNVPNIFDEYDYVEITRKIHGTNARYGIVKKTKLSLWDKIKKFFGFDLGWGEYEFVVGSHNVEKGSDTQGFYDTNVWYDIEKKYDIKNKLWNLVKKNISIKGNDTSIGSGLIIYGEIYGKGIQKNYEYGLDDIQLCIFDVELNKKYFNLTSAEFVVNDYLKLPYVEVLHKGLYSEEVKNKFVFNNFINNTKVPHEGIVIKAVDGNRAKVAKVINPDYLIYSEKNNVGDSH